MKRKKEEKERRKGTKGRKRERKERDGRWEKEKEKERKRGGLNEVARNRKCNVRSHRLSYSRQTTDIRSVTRCELHVRLQDRVR